MDGDLTRKQTMLTLAYAADAPASLTGDVRQVNDGALAIVRCVLADAPAVRGEWELVWGPVVYTFPFSTYSDNTMFVVRSTTQPDTYTIAIAGTNSKSFSDWLIEDFWIVPLEEWPYGDPPDELDTKISKGTATGLDALQGMLPLSGIPGACQLLIEYLRAAVAAASGPVTIHVTGHSLGGALAPTLALWLIDTQGTDARGGGVPWDPESKATVSCTAFAGPSAGNGDFATWSNQRMPGDQLLVVDNSLDVVPHAWNTTTLMEIPFLYLPKYRLPLDVTAAVLAIAKLTQKLDYQKIGEGDQVQPITGELSTVTSSDSKLKEFLEEAGYQHVVAYPDALGLPNLRQLLEDCAAQANGGG